MNELAYVLYPHTPTNDDELELKVGDKIEVLGLAEEGWWKGRLKGRVGVFPSNFVQVIDKCSEITSSTTQVTTPTTATIAQSTTNSSSPSATSNPLAVASKLNLFGSKSSKSSPSSNSLNSNSSSNNNNNNNNNLSMDNTQQSQDNPVLIPGGEDQSMNSSERRPKPIRGIGYGDIFASVGKSKPLPPDPTGKPVSERSNTNTASTILKQIPKKPPPPAPTMDINNSNSNGNSNPDQAPALPPKPVNQFSPHLQQHSRPLPPPIVAAHHHHHHHHHHPHHQQQQQNPQIVREQAKVIYAYDPVNDDELAIQVGDIIDIIDKNIEDAGWWKGELRGKIGVFPDNFVQLIEVPIEIPSTQDHWLSNNRVSATNPQSQLTSNINQSINEGKIKSVFAATPKGFSKELENNLEKQQQYNSPVSFLSLKRNKLQQQLSSGLASESTMNGDNINDNKSESDNVIAPIETSITKLNHITANRAKGPSRRPPSNVLNKRNQLDNNHVKKDSNGQDEASTTTLGSLAINSSSHQSSNPIHDSTTLSSLPTSGGRGQQHTAAASIGSSSSYSSASSKPAIDTTTTSAPIKPSLSLENVIDNNNQAPSTPKTSQRAAQTPTTPDKSKATTTPPWMVELRKAHAEKKRDTPIATNSEIDDISSTSNAKISDSAAIGVPALIETRTTETTPLAERKSALQSLRGAYNNQSVPPSSGAVKSLSSRYSGDFNANLQNESQRNSLLGTNSIVNQDNSNNESSPLQNRLSNVQNNKNNSPSATTNKSELNPSHVINAASNHQNSNEISNSNVNNNNSNNTNVPSSSVNKFSVAVTNVLQSNLDNNQNIHQKFNSTSESTAPQKSPKTIVKSELDAPNRSKVIDQAPGLSSAQYDNLLKQISMNITSEISELKVEFKRMQAELHGLTEMKSTLEVMKNELKSCQSATENQKRYIKELVNNLADERKKIAAMQVEIDRTLK